MIIVCSVYDMPKATRDARATHVVSLIQADEMPDTPADPPGVRHLKIDVHDITEPAVGMILPREDHVAELIEFAAGWDRRTPMTVHCRMGDIPTVVNSDSL